MGYLLIYIITTVIGYFVVEKFDLNRREIMELLLLPLVMPGVLTFVVKILTVENFISSETLLGLLVSPILLLIIVIVVLPILLVPTLLILIMKKNYKNQPIVFFFISSLIGGLIASLIALEIEVILTGIILALFSVMIQYFYFDKKRNRSIK